MSKHITFVEENVAGEGFLRDDNTISVVKSQACTDELHALQLASSWADTYGATFLITLPPSDSYTFHTNQEA
jgi:hypothetical protein